MGARRKQGAPDRKPLSSPLERLRRRVQPSEAGDTLIEVLIAIVIIALTVTALLGALVTAITSSTTEQSLATVDSVLNGFAQAAQYEVQQTSVFINCDTNPYRLISAPSPASGPAGSAATVFVTGFAASHPLTVTVGGTTATLANGSMSSTDGNGDATVTFTVPAGLTGSQIVSVSDGTSTPSPTAFFVGGTVKGTTPEGYLISVNPVQQWDAQATNWVNANSPTCPMSGSQQITVVAHAPDGSAGIAEFRRAGPGDHHRPGDGHVVLADADVRGHPDVHGQGGSAQQHHRGAHRECPVGLFAEPGLAVV